MCIDLGLIESALHHFCQDVKEVRVQNAYVLTNALNRGSSAQMQYIIERQFLRGCGNLIEQTSENSKSQLILLDGLNYVLEYGQLMVESGEKEENPFTEEIQDIGLLDRIEDL